MPETLVRYQPSGNVGVRFWIVLPLAWIVASAIGFVYQYGAEFNPFLIVTPLLTLAFGLVLAGVGIATIWLGQVRHRAAALLASWTLALVGFGAAWLAKLGVFGADLSFAPTAWRGPFSVGTVGSGTTRLDPLLLLVCWFGEALVFVLPAALTSFSWWRRAVYCEEAQRFVRARKVASTYGPSPIALREAVREHGLEGLCDFPFHSIPEGDRDGEFRFYVHRTEPNSGGKQWLTVLWHGKLETPRGRSAPRVVLVLRRVRVDGNKVSESFFLSQWRDRAQSHET